MNKHSHDADRDWRTMNRMWRAVVAPLALSLACVNGNAAGPSLPSSLSKADRQLSAAETSVLRGVQGRPFATLALLSFLPDAPSIRDGALYFESLPEAALTSLLLKSTDRDAIAALLGTLQWNVYSASRLLVRVSWSVRPANSSAKVVQIHTQLLIAASDFQHPALESDTTVLLKEGTVWFLGPAAPL